MEENHARARVLRKHPVTFKLVLLMESGLVGLNGLHAPWSVVEEPRVELVSVLLLNMEETRVWDQLLIRHPATLNPVLLMENGLTGPAGLIAHWSVVEETSIELESVLLLNMEESHVRVQILISHPVTLNLVLLMVSGQSGLIGVHAQWTVVEDFRIELVFVLLLNMEVTHVWAQLHSRHLVTPTLALLMASGQCGRVGMNVQ